MLNFRADAILLDIEGTTSSVTFVYDVMFPYVRQHLADYVSDHWTTQRLQEACTLVAADADPEQAAVLIDRSQPDEHRKSWFIREVLRQMDADMKVTGLKTLQGDIWKAGFEDRSLVAHVYEDVLPSLEKWQAAGLSIRVYSSGSIAAQRLFFGHTKHGDLLSFFGGHYDTTIGNKKSTASYLAIANDWQLAPSQILFVSDINDELDAARDAGLQTALSCRGELVPSNHPTCTSFDEIAIAS